MPTPPTKTLRETLTIAANALRAKPQISTIPTGFAKILGLFLPPIREIMQMHFLFDQPYIVDSTKFRKRFWSDVDPLEKNVAETARSYLTNPE